MDYKILHEEYVYEGFLKIKKAGINHDTFAPGGPITIERESMERGDSVAVVIFEEDTDSFLFTKQFRYPTVSTGSGWTTEIVAGILEPGEDPETTALREIEEEIGYRAAGLKFISDFYTSPGGSSERIFLFYTDLTSADQHGIGGGTPNEDIELVKIGRQEVKEMLMNNQIKDAKTLLGLMYYFLWKNP